MACFEILFCILSGINGNLEVLVYTVVLIIKPTRCTNFSNLFLE